MTPVLFFHYVPVEGRNITRRFKMISTMGKDVGSPGQLFFHPRSSQKYSLGDKPVTYDKTMANTKVPEYSLQIIQTSHKPAVIEFLRNFFLRDEPLNIETGMNLEYINGRTCLEIESYCTDSISEGNSVMAVTDTGKIVGVCLNGRVPKEDTEEKECENEKFRKVFLLLTEAARQTDIFSKYPKLERLLDVKIISVDSAWRGKGICKALLEQTKKVAKEQGFQMVKVDCTSHISALAVEKLGFNRIHVLKYEDHFQDGNDKPVFNPPPPHWAVQVYVYKLDSSII